jgi:hypothetical protein
VVYRDVTRQAKGLYRLKHVGALGSGLAYLSRYNSGWFCHSVVIRGVEFSANLMVLDTKGIDVILGMGTLVRWGVRIDCA